MVEIMRKNVVASIAVEASCIRGCRRDAKAVPDGEHKLEGGHAEDMPGGECVKPDTGQAARTAAQTHNARSPAWVLTSWTGRSTAWRALSTDFVTYCWTACSTLATTRLVVPELHGCMQPRPEPLAALRLGAGARPKTFRALAQRCGAHRRCRQGRRRADVRRRAHDPEAAQAGWENDQGCCTIIIWRVAHYLAVCSHDRVLGLAQKTRRAVPGERPLEVEHAALERPSTK